MSKSSSFRKNWSTWWSASPLLGILVAILFLPACGYQLSAQAPIVLPGERTHLFLSKVTNPTTETWMEPMLRRAIRDELTRRGKVTWVDRESAQATVTVDVQQYSTSTVLEGRDERTLKSSAQILLVVNFLDAETNTLIWTSGPVVGRETYRDERGKRQATQDAVDLAVRIVADRMNRNF